MTPVSTCDGNLGGALEGLYRPLPPPARRRTSAAAALRPSPALPSPAGQHPLSPGGRAAGEPGAAAAAMSYSLRKDQIIQDADDGSSDDVPELASEGSEYSGSDDERPSRARNGSGAAVRAPAAGGRAAPQAAAAPAAGGGDAMPALGAVDEVCCCCCAVSAPMESSHVAVWPLCISICCACGCAMPFAQAAGTLPAEQSPHDCTQWLLPAEDDEEEDWPSGLASAGEEEEGVGSYHSESERLWAVEGVAAGQGVQIAIADVAMLLECRHMRAHTAQREQARSSNEWEMK